MHNLLKRMHAAPGHVAMYYQPLDGGCALMMNETMPLMAASVIKIPIMVEAFRQFESGKLSPEETHRLADSEKMPSCGALNRMHAGLELTMRDLVELMIILSDNTATNILIDRLGIEHVNETMRGLGLKQTVLRRKLFDKEGKARGLENTVGARDIGMLLEKMYRGTLVSEAASAQMLEILKSQKLNGKMPFYLHEHGIPIAHKTGEDDGITHDVGIVFTRRPFVLCMLSNRTEVPAFERMIQEMTRDFAEENL
jgi:beta-lactamase class A